MTFWRGSGLEEFSMLFRKQATTQMGKLNLKNFT